MLEREAGPHIARLRVDESVAAPCWRVLPARDGRGGHGDLQAMWQPSPYALILRQPANLHPKRVPRRQQPAPLEAAVPCSADWRVACLFSRRLALRFSPSSTLFFFFYVFFTTSLINGYIFTSNGQLQRSKLLR